MNITAMNILCKSRETWKLFDYGLSWPNIKYKTFLSVSPKPNFLTIPTLFFHSAGLILDLTTIRSTNFAALLLSFMNGHIYPFRV